MTKHALQVREVESEALDVMKNAFSKERSDSKSNDKDRSDSGAASPVDLRHLSGSKVELKHGLRNMSHAVKTTSAHQREKSKTRN